MFAFKKIINNKKGITLVELLIVVPFITIIFALAFNMIFLIQKSFKTVNAGFDTAEEIRIFQIAIQKEANSGKKAEEANDVLTRISSSELYIYTDIDGDKIPEIIRYKLDTITKELKKDVKYRNTGSDEYPYKYNLNSFIEEKVVLKNITNTDIFGTVDVVRVTQKSEGADHRRKVPMKLIIKNGDKNVEINTYLVTKSRTEAGDE